MSSNQTTRRALLSGGARVAAYAAGAAIVGGVVDVADAKGATPARAAWDAALARAEKAEREDKAFEVIYDRARAAWKADITADADADVDWQQFPFENRRQLLHDVNLDEYEAKFVAGEGKFWWGQSLGDKKLAGIAQLRRFRAERAAVTEHHNMEAIEARWEDLSDASYKATWDVFNMPAPDRDALLWKTEHLFARVEEHDGDHCPSWSQKVMLVYLADARRLLAREA